jgi:hypothetical protein
MLSGKLIRLIETHSDEISRRALRQIREDPNLKEIHRLPDSELRDRWKIVLQNLGHWLSAGKEARLIYQYEELGRARFAEHVPLHETVRALHILRNQMIDFLSEQGLPENTMQVYAEEEMEYRVTRFFDELVYRFVRGYEEAMKMAAHMA